MCTVWRALRERRSLLKENVLKKVPVGVELEDNELLTLIEEEIQGMQQDGYLRLEEKKQLRHMVFNALRRMDVLQDLLDDEEVTEIMVNGAEHIFVEKEGNLTETGYRFENRQRLEDIAQQIASSGNRLVNESNPILDARLEDGSRVNIVVPPIAIEGPVITIRKFPKEAMTIQNLVRLEARNANVEGKNQVTIRDLVKSALRMRPDRIIVGEIRDTAAIDLLTAMNTGHDGSLSTGHANSPADMLNRLETLVLMGLDIPLAAIRQQIASGIDIVVHLGRLRDKSRKVLEVSEVGDVVNGKICLRPLYRFCERGERNGKVIGRLEKTDRELQAVEKCQRAGIDLISGEMRGT